MRILVTGAAGYIGTRLVPVLVERGHDVSALDTGFYAESWLAVDDVAPCAIVNADTRDLRDADLRGLDAVVHLGELSNDPLGQLDPVVTHEINDRASRALAEACRRAGVPRFVYSSSCSVYGAADGPEAVTEGSSTKPQTVYAECKLRVEAALRELADERFCPVILRNATAFGPSPRMRFDLVLNNLAGLAWSTGEIRVVSDGTPWRPLVHVLDICHAIACAVEAPAEAVHAETFNVGDDQHNYRVRDLAEIVGAVFPGCRVTFGLNGGDRRSYAVSFRKLAERLPDFKASRDAAYGAWELCRWFGKLGLTHEMFASRCYTRIRQIEHLLASSELDTSLRWRRARVAA